MPLNVDGKPGDESALPLVGTRVLCMAGQYPGPYATLLLADLGADVVLVERPDSGDPTRTMPAFFESLNRHKRSITIDPKMPQQYERLLSLVARCDVFIEGSRPGVAERLRLDAPTLRKRNPALIYASISAYGQDGPYRERPAHDLSLQAVAGLLHGIEQRGAAHPYVPWADVLSGINCALGIVSALLRRDRTGSGAVLDVAMSDCLASAMTAMLGPILNGESPFIIQQPGYASYRCADGSWINLSITHEEHLWKRLVDAIGLPEFADIDAQGRSDNCSTIANRLAQTFASRTRAQWEVILDACDTAWAPVLAPEEVVRDPHFLARGLFVPMGETKRAVRQPIRFDGDAVASLAPAPALGADDDADFW